MKRFDLAPYTPTSKGTCPACGRKKSLRRYIDLTTGEYLPDHIGMCDHLEKCGYKYTAWDWVKEQNIKKTSVAKKDVHESVKLPKKGEFDLIPKQTMLDTIPTNYVDPLCTFLYRHFNTTRVDLVLNDYKVGNIERWGRIATVFWLISLTGVRSGKIMAYDMVDGDVKRVKEEDGEGDTFSLMNWYHSIHFEQDEFTFEGCFFGEHLLAKYPEKDVHIVESEKSALLASIVWPRYLWMACGSLTGLSKEKLGALHGRRIRLYPDKGSVPMDDYEQWRKDNNMKLLGWNYWTEKAEEFSKIGYDIECRDFLEKQSEFENGDDIGDMIITKLMTR